MLAMIGESAAKQAWHAINAQVDGCIFCTTSSTPSLTALLTDHAALRYMVVWLEPNQHWSDGHILAAAKYLHSAGGLILMGSGDQLKRLQGNSLLHIAGDASDVLRILRSRSVPQEQVKVLPGKGLEIHPMQIPDSVIVLLDVIGSQSRIGCTTQAIALWHYCKILGFDPAVVADPQWIQQMADLMHGIEIDGGAKIEGVHFVTDTHRIYDCYIRDVGTGVRNLSSDSNALILVAGAKPWELENTMRTVRAIMPKEMSVLLSFATSDSCKLLQVLFGRNTVVDVPWLPDPWQPSIAMLAVFDKLLRSKLESICREESNYAIQANNPSNRYRASVEANSDRRIAD